MDSNHRLSILKDNRKIRLDLLVHRLNLVESRSQAESYIKLGKIEVEGRVMRKPGSFVPIDAKIKITQQSQYVSRAGLKLESVARDLNLDFRNKVVLDVGSSTGGFTDYVLKHQAKKVIAIDVGTDQLHPRLRADSRVEVHEKTDIRKFKTDQKLDIALIDVSFISLREVLPSVANLVGSEAEIVAMFKPQFEAGKDGTNKGVVKNNSLRRKIIKEFEEWLRMNKFSVQSKRDSSIRGQKGNQERFYRLKVVAV